MVIFPKHEINIIYSTKRSSSGQTLQICVRTHQSETFEFDT